MKLANNLRFLNTVLNRYKWQAALEILGVLLIAAMIARSVWLIQNHIENVAPASKRIFFIFQLSLLSLSLSGISKLIEALLIDGLSLTAATEISFKAFGLFDRFLAFFLGFNIFYRVMRVDLQLVLAVLLMVIDK